MKRRLDIDVPKLLQDLGIKARKSGSEYRGLCPSPKHHQKAGGPGSWQIIPSGPSAGLHVCHSCGFGGGLVVLVRDVKGFTGPDAGKLAWRWLCEYAGFVIPSGATPTWTPKIDEKEGPELWYPDDSVPLWGDLSRACAPAREYLLNRGVTGEEIERFGMAAVPASAHSYGGRVIVPVFVGGEMVDFVARLFVPAKGMIPKALSGRRDHGAKKELALWNFDALEKAKPVYVTEGVWGALAVMRAGFKNVVAACGSAWSPERTDLLSPWEEVVLIPDGDEAGSKLESRASSLRFSHRLRVVGLRSGEQPDTIDPEALRTAIRSARGASFSSVRPVRPVAFLGK